MKSYLTILLFIFFCSCNRQLFVDKRRVVQDQNGFLVFFQNHVVFFPTKDTVDNVFLNQRQKSTGYKLSFDTDWLESLSIDYSHLFNEGGSVKFSIIPVSVRSYLGVDWQNHREEGSIEYKWNNRKNVLHYKLYDWRQILMISVVRKNDLERLKNVPLKDPPPLHW